MNASGTLREHNSQLKHIDVRSLEVVVIGGGAAGFFAAVTCAETFPDVRVTLLEAAYQPLTKVRISGGGRCNVTHACFDPAILVQHYPRGGKALRGAFSRFQPQDTVAWFESRGVRLKTEADGRMFPVTDNSATIVDCLMQSAQAAGVKVRTQAAVAVIRQLSSPDDSGVNPKSKIQNPKSDGRWEIQLKSGEVLSCDRILLATGSNPAGYKWAKNLGHTIEPPVPSLFTFNISDRRLQDLAGVSVESVRVRLPIAKGSDLEQTGALLVTHWGLSGPAILKLSAWGARVLCDRHYHMPLLVNWLPQYDREKLRQMLLAVKSQLPQRQISTSCPVPLPRRLWQSLIAAAGISPDDRWAGLSHKTLNLLIQELNQGEYQIEGKGVFKEEFVTCGGVNLKQVDFKTMESRRCPGIYFAGEILDIDGVTGGFNFQSAWTTAWLAGQAMGK